MNPDAAAASGAGKGNTKKVYADPEPSKEIPVLAYRHDDDDDEGGHSPPEYAMIELNGNLIPPVEFPPGETCLQIFGKDRTVELGKLYRKGPEQASVAQHGVA